jgi:hypothetical protein
MEFQFQTIARCHTSDVWDIFQNIEDWRQHTPAFGHAGWVHGEPWKAGSRFFLELKFPQRIDLEVVVLKNKVPHEIVILSHGGGVATEQWIQITAEGPAETLIRAHAALVGGEAYQEESIRQSLATFYKSWLDGLKTAAERHCSMVAL